MDARFRPIPELGSFCALFYRLSVVDIASITWRIAKHLILWSGGSIALGIVLVVSPWPFLEGLGLQMGVWGAIDLVIALFGMGRARKLYESSPEEHRVVQEALRLRRILTINARLDVLYILVGGAVVVAFRRDPFLLGNGAGILIQGAFLLVFDRVHAARLPDRSPTWYDDAP